MLELFNRNKKKASRKTASSSGYVKPRETSSPMSNPLHPANPLNPAYSDDEPRSRTSIASTAPSSSYSGSSSSSDSGSSSSSSCGDGGGGGAC